MELRDVSFNPPTDCIISRNPAFISQILCIFDVLKKEQNVMLSDNKVIEVFYMADDFCNFFNETVKKHSIDGAKKHRNKPGRLSDSEIITILIMFHMGGFRCLKYFYVNYICKHCGSSVEMHQANPPTTN